MAAVFGLGLLGFWHLAGIVWWMGVPVLVLEHLVGSAMGWREEEH
jgi:hypothetical protein